MNLIIRKLKPVVFLLILCSFPVSACRKAAAVEFSLEPSPLLSAGIGWGVVNIAWVRLKNEPGHASEDAAFVRRQDVLELVGRVRRGTGRDAGIWYLAKLGETSGWIHESALTRYQSRDQAEYSVRDK